MFLLKRNQRKKSPPNPKNKNTNIWGNNLYSRVSENTLTVLPCIWFNSEWGYEDTILEPFKKIDNIKFFDGAFTWHWHNRWDSEIEDGSKFDILDKIIEQKFKTETFVTSLLNKLRGH